MSEPKARFWEVEAIRKILGMALNLSDREIEGTPRKMLQDLMATNFTREQAWGVMVAISEGKNEEFCSRFVLELLNVQAHYQDPATEEKP